jgi:hypothetical protein
MSNTHKPEIQNIKVDGYNIVSYSYGKGEHVLFLLNGGPGLPCDYLRDPHIHLVEEGYVDLANNRMVNQDLRLTRTIHVLPCHSCN